jgi:hypothetical protein
MKICVWNLKKFDHITRGEWNNFKFKNHIFCLCRRDKTSNKTPILSILPMYTTPYYWCKLWWYTINLNRRILSYWFFSNKYRIVWYTIKEPHFNAQIWHLNLHSINGRRIDRIDNSKWALVLLLQLPTWTWDFWRSERVQFPVHW